MSRPIIKAPAINVGAIDRIRDLHITSRRDVKIEEHLRKLLRKDSNGNLVLEPVKYTRQKETRGLVVVGEAGCGKSQLIEVALLENPVFSELLQQGSYGLINITTPNPATFKSVGLEILMKLGYDEISPTKRDWDIWKLIRHRTKLLGVKMLWLDEAHDLMKTKTDKEKVLRTLKTLMQGEDALIVILSGTELLADLIASDDQVERRFDKLFLPKINYATDRKGLIKIIERFSKIVGRAITVDDELIQRIMYVSRYRFGLCIELVVEAFAHALETHDRIITVDDFAAIFAMKHGCDISDNVFLSPNWSKIEFSQAGEDRSGKSANSRRKK